MRNLLPLFCALLPSALYHPAAESATPQFESGFESGSYASEKFSPHMNDAAAGVSSENGASVQIVTDLKANGSRSSKHVLDDSNPKRNNFRSELYFAKKLGDVKFNSEYWFGMNFYYDDWAPDSNPEGAPFQVHRRPSSWKRTCGGNVSAWSNAPFYISSQNNKIMYKTWQGISSFEEPVVTKKWYNIVYHFDIGWDNDGYVEAWRDGVKIFRRDGALFVGPLDDCGLPWRNNYFNIGIYKWDWKATRPRTRSTKRILYIDDVYLYEGADGYNQVYHPASDSRAAPHP